MSLDLVCSPFSSHDDINSRWQNNADPMGGLSQPMTTQGSASRSSSEGWRTPPSAQSTISLRVVVPPSHDEAASSPMTEESHEVRLGFLPTPARPPHRIQLRRSARNAARTMNPLPYSGRGSAMVKGELAFA